MFERIRNDNFVYQASDNELISLREDLSIVHLSNHLYISLLYYITFSLCGQVLKQLAVIGVARNFGNINEQPYLVFIP